MKNKTDKNIISFSLYGELPKYCQGMIENSLLAKTIYPNWKVRVYYDRAKVPKETVLELEKNGCEMVDMYNSNMGGMFWRFLVNDEPEPGRYIIRDADSRLNEREKKAVDEWFMSHKPFHTIKDHPGHTEPMMGGMWGGTRGIIKNMKFLIDKYPASREFSYQADQIFLKHVLWPFIKDKTLEHNSNIAGSDFANSRKDRFVGEVYNDKNEPVEWGAVTVK